jgi:hypothetical protein
LCERGSCLFAVEAKFYGPLIVLKDCTGEVMNYQIIFGNVIVGGVTVDLPGVPIQLENIENSLIVMVDNRATPNNLFRISSEGEIEWQMQFANIKKPPRFKKFSVKNKKIIVSDVTGTKYLVDFSSGKIIEKETDDPRKVIRDFLKKRSAARKN